MRLRTTALSILGLLALAAPARAAVAPGRVTFPLGDGKVVDSVDAFGLDVGAPLPDGGFVLAGVDRGRGVVLAQLHADGSLDASFGNGGIAHVAVPFGGQTIGPNVFKLLRRPDGRLIVVYTGAANSKYELPQLELAGITPTGVLDTSFGRNGIAQPGIEGTDAVLAADGSIVATGNVGSFPPTIEHDPNVKPNFTWVVTRLTPSGALDPTFGQNGIASLPGTSARGLGISVLTSGRITTIGQDASGVKLARLLPNGAMDPTWNGGAPATVPTSLPWPFGVLARTDGSVDVLASGPAGAELRRYTPTGTQDSGFGTVTLPGGPGIPDLLAAPDGGDLVVGPTTLNPQLQAPAERIARVAPDGAVTAKADVPTPFGGGVATFFRRLTAPLVGTLSQSGFHAGHAFVRPDGSVVVPGTVNVVQYTGEGEGFEVEQAAIVSIGPGLSLDGSFGGPVSPARLGLSVPRQRASTALGRNRLAVTVIARTNGPGLALLTVKAGRRTVARSIAPVLRGGAQRLHAFLTLGGRRYLRHRHHVRVSVRATFEDLLAQRRSASARGTLR